MCANVQLVSMPNSLCLQGLAPGSPLSLIEQTNDHLSICLCTVYVRLGVALAEFFTAVDRAMGGHTGGGQERQLDKLEGSSFIPKCIYYFIENIKRTSEVAI